MMTFSPPREITATYRIVTPMFLGGESHQVDSKVFRNASFKGALRFWWRALNWGRMLKNAGQNKTEALKTLHAEEGRLFGKASDGENSQQSRVRLSSTLQNAKVVGINSNDKDMNDLSYLLGLGLYANNDKGPAGQKGVQRSRIAGGAMVSFTLDFKPQERHQGKDQGITDSDIENIKQAVIALGLFGGLGSRSRKGFGSLAIQSIKGVDGKTQKFDGIDDIKQFIAGIDFSAAGDAPLSAFTCDTRIDQSEKGRDATQVLKTVCNQLHAYRDGTVGRSGRLNNFGEDRVLAKSAQQGQPIPSLPERAIFGLPHNYQWKEAGDPKLEIAPSSSERNRRASPLFIHVHEFPDKSFVAIQTLLSTTFLPQGTQIALKSYVNKKLSESKSRSMTVPEMNYQTIHDYLNDHFPHNEVLRSGR